MRVTAGIIICIAVLSGCNRQPAQKQIAPPANAGFGRWMILSAGQTKEPKFDVWSVWRLDTKTGDLEFCSYSILTFARDKRPIETNECQPVIKAHPSRTLQTESSHH
jgi:hypothetical protein